ncbi:MAG: RHS repeat protein, partial [Clostridia bacterium]|nr:RHS repeat protein [Clostridia bacterium]
MSKRKLQLAQEAINTFSYTVANGKLIHADVHRVGYSMGTIHRMYMTLNLPTLPPAAKLLKAKLTLQQSISALSPEETPVMAVYQVPATLVSGQAPADYDTKLLDYAPMVVGGQDANDVTYTLDITQLMDAKDRDSNTISLVLKLADEAIQSTKYIILVGSANSTLAPSLVVEYESGFDVSMSEATHTHAIGRFGTAGIQLQNGNMLIESEDFTWGGNRMPVTLQHLYTGALAGNQFTANADIALNTADFSAMKMGRGWRMNLMQSMVPATVLHNDNSVNGYLYMDEAGQEYSFAQSDLQEDQRTDQEGNEYHLFRETDEGDWQYDAVKKELYVGDETYTFDASGRLARVKDQYGNQQTIQYADGQIDYVLDGAGRKFDFTYSNGFLTKITAPDGTAISYTYTNELLTDITYPDGRKACIGYDEKGHPVLIELKDKNGVLVYATQYMYSGNRVISVTEYGSNLQMGQHTTYEYSLAARSTKVMTHEKQEEGTINEDVTITTVYNFDEEGDMAGSYVYTKETGNVQVENQNSGTIHPYVGDGIGVVSNINNLLKNHSFDDLSHWQAENANSSNFFVSRFSNQSYAKFGRYLLRLTSWEESVVENGVYQQTDVLPKGDYVFSAYVRPYTNMSGNDNAFLRVTDSNGSVLAESEWLTQSESEYVRLLVPFTLAEAKAVQVHILMNGRFTMYVDGAQLENNQSANEYNMLENGNFELGDHGWDLANRTDAGITADQRFNMSHALQLQGDINQQRKVSQSLFVKSDSSSKESFTLSGWAKANSLPLNSKGEGISPSFCLKAIIHYKDGEQQVETANFAACTDEWQLASVAFEKERYAVVSSLEIICEYNHNSGVAYFDDIQLIRNSWETNVPSNEFGSAVEEEQSVESDDVESIAAASGSREEIKGFEEVIDAFGNALTETTFEDGEFGTIYRSLGYDDNGNNLIREIDAKGDETTYIVEQATSQNKEVIDRLGNKTAYEYDVNGRTTKVTNKNAQNQELANVSYAYDAFDNMTEIVRGDGMKYILGYNAFHTLESIGVAGKSEPLVQYTYKNGNGRLKQMTYANGHRMEAAYNGLGQMVSEIWYDQWDGLSGHYKYVYDGAGNIVQTLDIMRGKAYNYEYEKGVLATAKEYNATFTEGVVTAKTLVASIAYRYDDNGQLVRKVMNWNNPDGVSREYTFSYQYPENGDPIVSYTAGNRDVIYHSKTDSFGRKEFDEMQLGKGFTSRQFIYHSGEVTQEHKENAKLKSSPTTGLVKEIVFSDGATVSYEYDAEERITKVTEVYTLKEPELTDEGYIFNERKVTDVTQYT